jgi:hypothetical protein
MPDGHSNPDEFNAGFNRLVGTSVPNATVIAASYPLAAVVVE